MDRKYWTYRGVTAYSEIGYWEMHYEGKVYRSFTRIFPENHEWTTKDGEEADPPTIRLLNETVQAVDNERLKKSPWD